MRMLTFFMIVNAVFNVNSVSVSNKLNGFIQHYETLDYDRSNIAPQHNRYRRSDSQDFVYLDFHSHGKTFHLKLWKDTSMFSHDVKFISNDDDPLDISYLSHLYGGFLTDEPTSHVFGSINDGIFEGKIYSKDGIFYIERSSKYQSLEKNTDGTVHSIIYRDDDVVDPYEDQRSGHVPGCAVTEEFSQARWMNSAKHQVVNKSDSHIVGSSIDTSRFKFSHAQRSFGNSSAWHKYSQKANNSIKQRTKRSIYRRRLAGNDVQDVGSCAISITIDPYMYKHFYKENSRNKFLAKMDIISLIAGHVSAASIIYQSTTFDGKYIHRFGSFEVGEINFIDFKTCEEGYIGQPSPYCKEYDAAGLLDLHSEYDHNAFCLAYVFTCRDFDGGVLGLAWVASQTNSGVGICARRKFGVFPKKPGIKGSLNTGIITFINFQVRIAEKVTQVTFAHELGHNFGAPHDLPYECKGNLIDEKTYGVCGNKRVEQSEECDCGMNDNECDEKCCYPLDIGPYLKTNPLAKPCTFKPGAECSPSAGPCCSKTCHFIPQSSNKQCMKDNECAHASSCNGRHASCPKPLAKSDGIECANNKRVCVDGECIGSICLKFDMEECFITSDRYPNITKQCEVACQKGDDNSTCKSTSEIPHLFKTPILLEKGDPCDDYRGFCDESLKCRQLNSLGPLVSFIRDLFIREFWTNLGKWMIEFWWVVVLICVFFILLTMLFIEFCALPVSYSTRHKPSVGFFQTFHHPHSRLQRRRQRLSIEKQPTSLSPPLSQQNQTARTPFGP